MRAKGLDYQGNVVSKPHQLTLAQVLPGLPPEHLGGAVNAVEFSTGYILEVLLNPKLVVAERETWGKAKTARIHATREEWQSIGIELVRRGICETMPEEELVYHNGELLAAGAFGVPKCGGKEGHNIGW
eukprot:6486036-Amphidinium_carterae.2